MTAPDRPRWLAPVAVAAAAAVVVVVVLVATSGHGGSGPAGTSGGATTGGPSTGGASTGGATTGGGSVPPPAPTTTTTSAGGLPLWPVTTDRQADAWRAHPSSRPWGGDPSAVAAHFVADFLHLPLLTTGPAVRANGAATVPVRSPAQVLAQARLVQVGGHPDSPWAVVEISGGRLRISSPVAEQPVTAPTPVRGTVNGVDESVVVTLLSTQGVRLARGQAAAGAARPWDVSLSWADRSWSAAALVAVTFSPKDGTTSGLAVTAVNRLGS